MAATKSKKNTRTRSETVSLSAVRNTIAQERGREVEKVGKQMRAYIRSHDADLRKQFNWPPESKERADGNRYPDMPRACADALTAHFTRATS